MKYLWNRAGTHPDIRHCRVLRWDHLQIGHIHQREMDIPQRQPPRHGDREAHALGQPDAMCLHTTTQQLHRSTGISNNCPHDVETDAGERGWSNATLNPCNIHLLGDLTQHCCSQNRKAANPR